MFCVPYSPIMCVLCDCLQQMMGTCPRLREVVELFVDVIEDNPDRIDSSEMASYFESLLNFFLSTFSTELDDNNVTCFLVYVNTLTAVDTFQQVIEVHQDGNEQSPLLNALSIDMAKRILGDILTHPQGDEKPVLPLGIFYRKVHNTCMHRNLH